ncbi:unnamed protein product [Didymodactylos carnosus]|uniref:Protein kinase domain-containing protein n=1 Tax=Didymodactylos carnosus TaxID=1234261 RepID=A0A814ZSH2_9BILA|nr:unnamed protein product [Didymodactylos carnosus]CAF1247608.1 unnamed protein product [Didymodactylos carnosus]CAF3848481.1 unnamed protein product [Didymodactylos carnosus]CAF4014750.1 unnamed protein product [Didymodactylos carnosus]
MELCQDETLIQRLEHYQHSIVEASEILRQITEGVAYIHEKKLIHGDIKPAKIFFCTTEKNFIKIGDFGLAASFDEMRASTQIYAAGNLIPLETLHGSLYYMSPEQENQLPYDEKTDLYALGIVFYELLHSFDTGTERVVALSKIRELTNSTLPPIFPKYEKSDNLNLLYEPIIIRLLKFLSSERPNAKDLLQDKSLLRLISRPWFKFREWTKESLNYKETDELRGITADRNVEYLVMNVSLNKQQWVIDIRTADSALTFQRRIVGVNNGTINHKLQMVSASANQWLLINEQNKLYLYNVEGQKDQTLEEIND